MAKVIHCKRCGAPFDEVERREFGPVTVTNFECPGCGCELELTMEKTNRVGETGKPVWSFTFRETPAEV